MKKIIALALVFLTVNLFAETEVKFSARKKRTITDPSRLYRLI